MGGTFKGGEYEEVFDKVELTPAQLALAHKCDSTITDLLKGKGLTDGTPLLYGRYDMVQLQNGEPAILEAELFDPQLFFPVDPTSAARFVDALIS